MAGQKSHRRIFIIGGVAALLMFGFSFAMVPLYSLLCKTVGINTSLKNGELLKPVQAVAAGTVDKSVDLSRSIKVEFVATNHNGMPWDFYPRVKSIQVHPGENNKINFYAKNTTSNTMTVQAIPSMTPTAALNHFHKIECFCFNQQTLKGRESRDMALVFKIDKDLPKDIRVITLSYTLFDATPKETRKG
jgi:cytochrome c oxidase assembly protein subunit 11